MPKSIPVIFSAFANDRTLGGRYLRNLAEEERRVRKALDRAKRAGLCDPMELPNATREEMWEVFLDPELAGRIAIFHFAGHAGGREILLETQEGAPEEVHAVGLAKFLGQQKSLKAVFLNGCSTEPQVNALLAAGVPAVIATSGAIDDQLATELSAWFYQSLAAGASLSEAFENAVSIVRTRIEDRRDRAYRPALPWQAGEAEDWPWKLHGEDRSKVWRLSDALGPTLTGRDTIEIPDPLPYLCDRGKQEGPLDAAVAAHRSRLPHRPLAVLLHGDYRQALDRFIDRLQDPTLPRFLGKAPLRRVGPIPFKDHPGARGLEERLGPLSRDLAEKLCGDRGAGLAAMAQAVAAFKSPVMVDTDFTVEDNKPDPEPELVSAWLSRLASWPDLPEGQDLIFLLRFSYRETVAPSRLQFWKKKSPSRRVTELLARVTARPPAGLGLAELPPLENIQEGEVRQWIEEHASVFICGVVGKARDSQVCDQLKEKVLELFRAAPSLPMEELAPKLRGQLLECLQPKGD